MSEMVERVATAIRKRALEYQIARLAATDATYLARAAIEEMREPTDEMLTAVNGNRLQYDEAVIEHADWRAMIDAALKP